MGAVVFVDGDQGTTGLQILGRLQGRTDIVLRTLSALGEHVLTAELESAIDGLVATLKRAGSTGTATALDTAMQQLARSIGRLGAKSITYVFNMLCGERHVAKGEITAVCCRVSNAGPPVGMPIPEWIREKLTN